MGRTTKSSYVIMILLFLVCLGAGPNSTSDENKTPQAEDNLERFSLEPIRVVYRQIEGTYLKSPRGVFVDRTKGEIYVADTSNDLVAVYNQEGLPLFAFGYNKELKEPMKAIADPSGRIYVLNGIPRALKVFTYRGEYLRDFPIAGLDAERDPTAIAVDRDGNIYIANGVSGQIQVYDPKYRLMLTFGSKKDGGSYFQNVQAIAVDPEGNIYVADARATPSIQVFSPEGKFLRGWGKHDAGRDNFSLPSGLAVDGEGRVVAVDMLRHTILVFTKDGKFLGRYGGLGRQPGAVTYPSDIAAGGDGRIYVVEKVGRRLQILQERPVAVGSGAAARRNPQDDALRQKTREQTADFLREMR